MRRKTLQLPLDLYRSLVKTKIGRRCENSDRLYKQANDFFQRADKNYCRDMYQSGTGHDEALYLIGNVQSPSEADGRVSRMVERARHLAVPHPRRFSGG